jgi:hypothetical protein
MQTENLLQVTILANQAFHAVLEFPAGRIKVLAQARRQALVDRRAVEFERLLEVGEHAIAFASDRLDINLATRMPEREQSQAQGRESVIVPICTFIVLRELGN